MALSPSLLVKLKYDGDRVPLPSSTYTAGDVVLIGTGTGIANSTAHAGFAAIAVNDQNALGTTGRTSSGLIRGIATFPKAAGTSCAIGKQVYWDFDNSVVVVDTPGTTVSAVALGRVIATATTATTSVDVLFFPTGIMGRDTTS